MTSACSMACSPSAVIKPGSPGPAPASHTQPFSNAGRRSARARWLCNGVGLTILRPGIVNDSISQLRYGNNREFVTRHSSYMDQVREERVARFSRTPGEKCRNADKVEHETQIRSQAQHV